jgi:hypothetical protein
MWAVLSSNHEKIGLTVVTDRKLSSNLVTEISVFRISFLFNPGVKIGEIYHTVSRCSSFALGLRVDTMQWTKEEPQKAVWTCHYAPEEKKCMIRLPNKVLFALWPRDEFHRI